MDIKYKTLSSRSAKLIKHFTDGNLPGFAIEEAFDLFKDASRDAVKKLLRDMTKRGLLLRIKEGVYWIIPYEQDAATYFPNSHLIAKYLVGNVDLL